MITVRIKHNNFPVRFTTGFAMSKVWIWNVADRGHPPHNDGKLLVVCKSDFNQLRMGFWKPIREGVLI